MTYLLLHINEFSYLLLSGTLKIHPSRLVQLSTDSDPIQIFRDSGYVKYSAPESYLVCQPSITEAQIEEPKSDSRHISISLSAVEKFIPVSSQAEVLLRPLINRSKLRISDPIFEESWQRFVDEEILRERRDAASAFACIFGFEKTGGEAWQAAPNLYVFMLKDLGAGQNEIERRVDGSDLGTFEFCVRLAHEHDAEWRKNDPGYVKLKEVRERELAGKKRSAFTFLESPKLCLALRDFEDESRSRFGYSPFALVPFFEFIRSHSRANGINFKQVHSTIRLLLSFGRAEDATDYAHLVGYWLGQDEVMPATYFILADRFPVFDHSSSTYPKRESLYIETPSETRDLFAIPFEASIDSSPSEEGALSPDLSIVHTRTGQESPDASLSSASISLPKSNLSYQNSHDRLSNKGTEEATAPVTSDPVLAKRIGKGKKDPNSRGSLETSGEEKSEGNADISIAPADNASSDRAGNECSPDQLPLPAVNDQLVETSNGSTIDDPSVHTPPAPKKSSRKNAKSKKEPLKE